MSRSPWMLPKPAKGIPRGPVTMEDAALGWRLVNPRMQALHGTDALGITVENMAEQYGDSREAQDAFALRSHQSAVAAIESGRLAQTAVPESIPARTEPPTEVTVDEGPRADTSLEQLGRLRAIFRDGGSVTAGNSSRLNAGATALVLMSGPDAERRGQEPLARFVDAAAAGAAPSILGIGPVPATRKLLARTPISGIDAIDLVELNEAFASQSVARVSDLGIDPAIVNVNGGAIALGRPLGCRAARMVGTLVRELRARKGRYGLASICIGVGQGISSLWEAL